MTAWRARPEKPYGQVRYYKNGGADEIIFVFKGGGTVETISESNVSRAEDYIVIRAHQLTGLVPDKVERKIISSSNQAVRSNSEALLNQEAKSKRERLIRSPIFTARRKLHTSDKEEDTKSWLRTARAGLGVTMAHHPFDVVGWDGYVYPFTFNAQDFEPITGTCINRHPFIRPLKFALCGVHIRAALFWIAPEAVKFVGARTTRSR